MNNRSHNHHINPFINGMLSRKRKFQEISNDSEMGTDSTLHTNSPLSSPEEAEFGRSQKRRLTTEHLSPEEEEKMVEIGQAKQILERNIQNSRLESSLRYSGFVSPIASPSSPQETQHQHEPQSIEPEEPEMMHKRHYFSLKGDIDYSKDLTEEQIAELRKVEAYYASRNLMIVSTFINQ
ncbi:unnamed protein product [Moneuplotes crassus]|uniref:Uncharacterized protein n=1 Tax=Euplotes crassus TaxID=5936 RepID=A0AAD1XTB5_EUPCR|nr:unnamed protein product [Moneuplotes crassus]